MTKASIEYNQNSCETKKATAENNAHVDLDESSRYLKVICNIFELPKTVTGTPHNLLGSEELSEYTSPSQFKRLDWQ